MPCAVLSRDLCEFFQLVSASLSTTLPADHPDPNSCDPCSHGSLIASTRFPRVTRGRLLVPHESPVHLFPPYMTIEPSPCPSLCHRLFNPNWVIKFITSRAVTVYYIPTIADCH